MTQELEKATIVPTEQASTPDSKRLKEAFHIASGQTMTANKVLVEALAGALDRIERLESLTFKRVVKIDK